MSQGGKLGNRDNWCMKAVKKQKEALITAGYKKARLDFAETHKYCTLNNWERVIWSDETKINILS